MAHVGYTLPAVWSKLNISVCSALGLQQQTESKSYIFVCPGRPKDASSIRAILFQVMTYSLIGG